MRHLLLCCALLATAACQSATDTPSPASPPPEASGDEPVFREDGTLTFFDETGTPLQTIRIEIADTDSTRERGMMARTSTPEDTGMLFLFDEGGPKSFWMLNTPMSLDLLFVAPDSQIVQINRYVRPLTTESTSTRASTQFVIELPAGGADAYGLREGMRVDWQRR